MTEADVAAAEVRQQTKSPAKDAPPPSSSRASSVFAAPVNMVRKAVVGTTSGTVFLARHVKDILKEDLLIDLRFEKYPADVSRSLRSLENLASYLRWLRGLLCVLGIASFVLSLLVILMNEIRLSWAIFFVSIVAEGVLLRIYSVKATIAGLTSPLYRDEASLFYSPHFYQMILEMIFWMIQCPPTFETVSPIDMLGFVVFLRMYSLVMYVNNATLVYRTFCRAMSVMVGVPLSNSFFIRTSLIYNKFKTGAVIITCTWLTLALMFSKAEDQAYSDSLWFTFVTVGTIGYGDFSAVTAVGRFSAFLMWVFALVMVGYAVVLTHDTLLLKEHELNLYLLFRSNQLRSKLSEQAARVIQACWRLHASRKRRSHFGQRNYLAWHVASEMNVMREHRELMRDAARRFRDSTKQALLPKAATKPSTNPNGTIEQLKAFDSAREYLRDSVAANDVTFCCPPSSPATTPSLKDPKLIDRLSSLEQRVHKLTHILQSLQATE